MTQRRQHLRNRNHFICTKFDWAKYKENELWTRHFFPNVLNVCQLKWVFFASSKIWIKIHIDLWLMENVNFNIIMTVNHYTSIHCNSEKTNLLIVICNISQIQCVCFVSFPNFIFICLRWYSASDTLVHTRARDTLTNAADQFWWNIIIWNAICCKSVHPMWAARGKDPKNTAIY